MDLLILIAVMLVLAAPFVIYSIRKSSRVDAVMSPVASALGARYANQVIRGEQQGVKFQIALLSDITMVNPVSLLNSALVGAVLNVTIKTPEIALLKDVSFERFVVRAKVPGLLPLGLVAVPSRWTSRPQRADISAGLSGDPELEKLYIFRTNDPVKTQRLLEDAEARQALKSLMQNPPGVGLVMDDCVHITYESETYPPALQSPEEARRCVDTVVQAALALDRVFSRIKEESDAAALM
jgi:hypothetical protein